ncbi:hypothetical protein FRX31_034072 [Thalictrum thalictroides]|uniref:Uncharacterized protein n=1 Tax=Thalictrum thalictroides TaxID=46969 RepID=A0A7J6UV58_THATH|nr:hypothetical protein FRX31_034072 [Thalictrum thalictroides]
MAHLIQDKLQLSKEQLRGCTLRVSALIQEQGWAILHPLQAILDVADLSPGRDRPNVNAEDEPVWCPDINGNFSVSSAYEAIRFKRVDVRWHKHVWNANVHPRLSANASQLCSNVASTDDNV